MSKVRVQLSLEPADARLLRMVAACRGTSMSQLVMEAVAEITDVSMLEEWRRANSRRGEPGDWEAVCREEEYRNRELLSDDTTKSDWEPRRGVCGECVEYDPDQCICLRFGRYAGPHDETCGHFCDAAIVEP